MTFIAAIGTFLLFGWIAPDAARAIIPREAPVSIIAAQMEGPRPIVQRTRERVNGGAWTTYYVLSDPMGNVIALATADGTLVAEYDYDPYGRLIRETGPKAASCPFRYSTKYRDPDLELYYYGHRWYDASSLKWLTPDPIGERGGANLTAFCDGDPINKVDPFGLRDELFGWVGLSYGFEVFPARDNLRPRVRLDMGIGARMELGVNLSVMSQVMASMLIGGPRTAADATKATWDVNLLGGVAVHRGHSDVEFPERITGITTGLMNDCGESAMLTLALNYNTGLRVWTTVADVGVRSGATMAGLYNDVFFGTDQGPTGGGYLRLGRTLIAHDVFTGPRIFGRRDLSNPRFYRQDPSEVVYNRSVTTIEYQPEKEYGLTDVTLQLYDPYGVVINPLHVIVNAWERLKCRLFPDKTYRPSLFFHFEDNEGFALTLRPRCYNSRERVMP